MRAARVHCLFTWQPFERHAGIDYDSPTVRANLTELRRMLTAAGWTEVGTPEDAMLAAEYFYDTPYHLTSEGARRRTERLIERLSEKGMLE